MQQPDVSVIITTYNGAKYLKKQIDAILAQTLLPAEIIICDDQSTDATLAIINSYLPNRLIKVYSNATRLGVVRNFQQAAKVAQKGNWLAFADQDDIWVPNKLQLLTAAMQQLDKNNVPALIFSDLSVINKDDKIVHKSFWDKQEIKPDKVKLSTLLYGNVVTGCTILINYPMALEFLKMSDTGFLHDEWLALIAYTFGNAKLLKDQLVLYRQHEHNVTFSESYSSAPNGQLAEITAHLTGKKKFLPRQFKLAKAFLETYGHKLNDSQTKTFKRFIALENKNYLVQRINRRIAYL